MSGRWHRLSLLAIGGLTEVGATPESGHVLIVSHAGRGLVDISRGELIARDRTGSHGDWFDETGPRAQAIPPDEGWVDVAGLAGGQLPLHNGEWSVELDPSGVLVQDDSGYTQLLEESEEIRAFGFTPNGELLVATPSSLAIYREHGWSDLGSET